MHQLVQSESWARLWLLAWATFLLDAPYFYEARENKRTDSTQEPVLYVPGEACVYEDRCAPDRPSAQFLPTKLSSFLHEKRHWA